MCFAYGRYYRLRRDFRAAEKYFEMASDILSRFGPSRGLDEAKETLETCKKRHN